jgi:hypothetical protein
MLAHLKIIWQFQQKCRDFLGRDILGTTDFRAESSLIQSSCRCLRERVRDFSEHIVEEKKIVRFVFVIRVIVPYVL